MKKSVFIILFLLASISLYAGNEIIAVMDFETSGVSEQEMIVLVDYISSFITNNHNFIVLDRRQREVVLNELEFSNSGCTEEDCQIEIGRLLSANRIIIGSLGAIGSLYILNIKLINVETGQTISNVSNQYKNIEELVMNSESTIDILFKKDRTNQDSQQPMISEEEQLRTDIKPLSPDDINSDTSSVLAIHPSENSVSQLPVYVAFDSAAGSNYPIEVNVGTSVNGMMKEEKERNKVLYSREAHSLNLSLEMYEKLKSNQIKGILQWLLIAGGGVSISSPLWSTQYDGAIFSIGLGAGAVLGGVLFALSKEEIIDLDNRPYNGFQF